MTSDKDIWVSGAGLKGGLSMEYILWKPCYCIGHQKIDGQHKQLVELLNVLIQKVCGACPKSVIDAALIKLINYAENHFRDEEALMESIGYPEFLEHQREHERLVMEVFAFKEKFDRGEVGKFELLEFMRDWLLNHVLDVDLKLKKYVRS